MVRTSILAGNGRSLRKIDAFVGLIDEFLEFGIRLWSIHPAAVWARICSFTADEALLARFFALSQETQGQGEQWDGDETGFHGLFLESGAIEFLVHFDGRILFARIRRR